MKVISLEIKNAARSLYVRGYPVAEIASQCNVSTRTIYNWIKEDSWDSINLKANGLQVISARICDLAYKENKTTGEIKELETLVKSIGALEVESAKAEKIRAEAKRIEAEAHCVYNGREIVSTVGEKKTFNKKKKRSQPKKNDITDIDLTVFDTVASSHFYHYQKKWRDNQHQRNRFILKSRQIGATYYFAFEAFEDACKTGRNKIFLSASKAQAKVFKAYIIGFALEHFQLELKGGDEIALYKDGKLHATFYFLSTNTASAQSYSGDLYIDEVFWIPNYTKLELVAKAMASHKHWRRTYFSTPSSIQHPAYKHWNGERFNSKRKNKVEIDLSPEKLLEGVLGEDRIWRNRVTVKDAEAQGCDLFDIDELIDEHTKEEFDNLYMCKFIDDKQSVFPFSELKPCLIDTSSRWANVNFEAERPIKNRPAALGYDPSRLRDNAALSLLEIPLAVTDKWRLIETQKFHGQSSEYQGARIREYFERYNIVHLGIDVTGIGYGVYEQIDDLEQVIPINYSLMIKTALVMNAKRIIQGKRFQYDIAHKDVSQSFMQITQQTTGNGAITYGANRSKETGHADIAWSIMHAFYYESLNGHQTTTDDANDFIIASG